MNTNFEYKKTVTGDVLDVIVASNDETSMEIQGFELKEFLYRSMPPSEKAEKFLVDVLKGQPATPEQIDAARILVNR